MKKAETVPGSSGAFIRVTNFPYVNFSDPVTAPDLNLASATLAAAIIIAANFILCAR